MAHFADFATGRSCRPTNAGLVALLRVSLSTVQRARRVLKELQLVVELVRGRSFMTKAERMAAYERGSKARRIAAEFALCSRRGRRRLQVVERDTPPHSTTVSSSSYERSTHLQTTTEATKAAPPPAHTRKLVPRPRGVDPVTMKLAVLVRRRLGWLGAISARRLAPTLHRFAQAGWSARDIDRAVADALASRGWRLPRQLTQPAAYLATLLRAVDPEDRPGAFDEFMAAQDAAQRTYERQLVYGSPCAHGQPAGDVPSPLYGRLACALCR